MDPFTLRSLRKNALLFVLPALFAVLFAGVANSETRKITGKIVGIDLDSNTIAVATNSGGTAIRVFELDDDVVVTRAGENADITDIDSGDLVSITYHQTDEGLDVVDQIAITTESPEEQV